VTHRVRDLAKAAGVDLDIKGIRHYTASQLLAAGFDLGNTAARLGHSGGGRHHAEALRRPGIRSRPARRRLPSAADHQIRGPERLMFSSAPKPYTRLPGLPWSVVSPLGAFMFLAAAMIIAAALIITAGPDSARQARGFPAP